MFRKSWLFVFKLWRRFGKIMPCSPLCRQHLALVQNRYVRNWIVSTITMMENSAGLFQFTRELPWAGFDLGTVNYLIRHFTEFHISVHDRIQGLIRTTTSGCRLCRRQQQARNSQNWISTCCSPWKMKTSLILYS